MGYQYLGYPKSRAITRYVRRAIRATFGHKAKRLSVIIIVLLVYPTNAAGVERIFSAVSRLKDKLSNRKSDCTLNALLHAKFNDCKIDDYSLL